MNVSKVPLLFLCLFSFSFVLGSNVDFLVEKDGGSEEEIIRGDLGKDYLSRLSFGASYTYLHLAGENDSSFVGNLGGAQIGYQYRPLKRFYADIKTSWKMGAVYASNRKKSLIYVDEFQRIGYTASFGADSAAASFFSGFGYRYYREKTNFGFMKDSLYLSNFLYIPVGALIQYAPSTYFSFALDFMWMPQIYASLKIKSDHKYKKIISSQLGSFSLYFPLSFTFNNLKEFNFVITPFYQRWKASGVAADNLVEKIKYKSINTYDYSGVDVNFQYCF
jgi:hypothetical protein